MSELEIRQARPEDVETIADILRAAEAWLRANGMPMWLPDELDLPRLRADVEAGLHFVAELENEVVGTLRFQLEDPEYWPDRPRGEAAYVHRLAVRRDQAGRGVGAALLEWAAARAGDLGFRWLRLDCDRDRPRLRAFYEREGFVHHSDRQVGRFLVARYQRPADERFSV